MKNKDHNKVAEHVGVLRSTNGNKEAILARICAHKSAVASILNAGMARGHRGNPAVGIRVHCLYGIPVLLSGIAALVLTAADVNLLEGHYKETLRNIMRLHSKTPRSVVYFLAGSLPGIALIHLRQMSLFGMITRLPGSILHRIALHTFSSGNIPKSSWFWQIRNLCLKYMLPHPIDLLYSKLKKDEFKILVKKKIVDYWEQLLREEASILPSLSFFNPFFMSLQKSHPLWTTAGSSPAKVAKATVQALMLSGRYRTESLTRHWGPNRSGDCKMSKECQNVSEDITHILRFCPALEATRKRLMDYTTAYASNLPDEVSSILMSSCSSESSNFVQFLLDCSNLPVVITLAQSFHKELDVISSFFEVTRTWVYALHRDRLKCLNRWGAHG